MAQEKSQMPKNQALPPKPKLPKDILPSERLALTTDEQNRLNYALFTVIGRGNNDEIMNLLTAGANIAATGIAGWTALHEAARNGHTETCALLLDEYAKTGIDIKRFMAARDSADMSVLHLAAQGGYTQTCALLLSEYAKAGGNTKEFIAAKSKSGWTALHEAARNGKTETCVLLIEKYAKASGDFYIWSYSPGPYIIRCGTKELIAAVDNRMFTASDWAAENGHRKIVQLLNSMEWLSDTLNDETFSSFMKSFGECTSSG